MKAGIRCRVLLPGPLIRADPWPVLSEYERPRSPEFLAHHRIRLATPHPAPAGTMSSDVSHSCDETAARLAPPSSGRFRRALTAPPACSRVRSAGVPCPRTYRAAAEFLAAGQNRTYVARAG